MLNYIVNDKSIKTRFFKSNFLFNQFFVGLDIITLKNSTDFTNYIRMQVEESKQDAEKDGVVVPTTVAEYCVKRSMNTEVMESQDDFMEYLEYEEEYVDDE